jgi:hypothetical protein
LLKIKLIAPFHKQAELEYAAGDPEWGWVVGLFPIAGKVRASMCPVCGRIVLHAEST